jgi:DNA-binding XRE family transcriptional regulator
MRQVDMTPVEFTSARKQLKKTQREMAGMLGISLKAVHSYEQGWRVIPGHVERQVLFLLGCVTKGSRKGPQCWTLNKCPPSRKRNCPAWELRCGRLCWMVNGRYCQGTLMNSWKEKMAICRNCVVMKGRGLDGDS